jgi:peptidoglycan/LPS O-acetylase OafA/YrhL
VSGTAQRVASKGIMAGSAPAVGYPLFDWLRFVLASVVVLGHAGLVTHSDVVGNLAVQVFFALSGWLIGGILLETRWQQLPRFFFNRATRIWIPYCFAALLLYMLSAVRDPLTFRWLEFLFYDLTFTHNWFTLRPDAGAALTQMPLKGTGNGFWSISVEEQFYLLAPLIIIALKYGRSPLLWAGVAALLWAFLLVDFASISLGVLAATIKKRHGDIHLGRAQVAFLLGVCAIALLALAKLSYERGAPFFAISTVLLCAWPGPRSSLGMFAGAVSYPVYLNHWIGAFVVHGIAKRVTFLAQPAEGLLSFILGIGAGTVAYLVIDRNVMRLRDNFYCLQLGKVLAATAYGLVMIGVAGGIILTR